MIKIKFHKNSKGYLVRRKTLRLIFLIYKSAKQNIEVSDQNTDYIYQIVNQENSSLVHHWAWIGSQESRFLKLISFFKYNDYGWSNDLIISLPYSDTPNLEMLSICFSFFLQLDRKKILSAPLSFLLYRFIVFSFHWLYKN